MSGLLDQALWALGRGTGLVALLLLTASLVLGVAGRSGRGLGLGRFGVQEVHRAAALTAVGLVAVHVTSLLLDPYAQLRLVDLLVPFLGQNSPIWLGLGTLALDLVALVTVVGLLRQRLGPRVFHAVHWTTYALWPVALLHALGTGSDATEPWFRISALACVGAVGGAAAWRLLPSYAERGHARLPRRAA